MRIITGKYKGRHFEIPRSFKARPTTDFAKENIFNVLNGYIDFEDAIALDLFSGTGSITLELLSRGCSQVISVELDRDHHRFIQECLNKLTKVEGQRSKVEGQRSKVEGQRSAVIPIRGDVFRFVKSCKQQFDFIFADPPYALDDLDTLPDKVFSKDILHPGAYFILEHPDEYDFQTHPYFVKEKKYGNVHFSFFEKPQTL